MNAISQTDPVTPIDAQVGQHCADALQRYLSERGYARQTIGHYVGCTEHFSVGPNDPGSAWVASTSRPSAIFSTII